MLFLDGDLKVGVGRLGANKFSFAEWIRWGTLNLVQCTLRFGSVDNKEAIRVRVSEHREITPTRLRFLRSTTVSCRSGIGWL